MIASCGSQLRYATVSLGMGGTMTRPVGLDFGVVFAMAEALDADRELLARILPEVEAAILRGIELGNDNPDDEEEVENG